MKIASSEILKLMDSKAVIINPKMFLYFFGGVTGQKGKIIIYYNYYYYYYYDYY